MTDHGKRWTLDVEDDGNGGLMLTLPHSLLKETGWREGDILKWIEREDGSWELKKQRNNEQSESAAS